MDTRPEARFRQEARMPTPRTLFSVAALLLIPALAAAESDLEAGKKALAAGKYDNAIASFGAALRADATSTAAYKGRGTAYAAKGKYDQAIADFRAAIRLDPSDAEAHGLLGTALQSTGKLAEAIAEFRQVLRLDPKNVVGYSRLGTALIATGRIEDAIAAFGRAIELDPKFALAYRQRAAARVLQKKYAEAAKDCAAAVRVAPKDAEAHRDLAWLLATCPDDKVRDGEQALKHAKKADDLSGGKAPRHWETLAAAHAACGHYKSAAKWQKKALEDKAYAKLHGKEARKRLELYEAGKPYLQGS
jgi:tetratricopeptide (TPR) repeat protein